MIALKLDKLYMLISVIFFTMALLVFFAAYFGLDIPVLFFFWINIALYPLVVILAFKYNWFIYFDGLFALLFPLYYGVSFIFGYFFSFSVIDEVIPALDYVFFICFSGWLMLLSVFIIRPKIKSDWIIYKMHELHADLRSQRRGHMLLFSLGMLIASFFLEKVSKIPLNSIFHNERLDVVSLVSPSGWYLKYLIIAYSWYVFFLLHSSAGKLFWARLYLLIPVLLYWFSLVVLGSRREIVFSVLPLFFFVFSLNGCRVTRNIFLYGVLTFLALLVFGAVRAGQGIVDLTFYSNMFGEFLFPISTLSYYVEYDQELRFGSTFFQFFVNFIPKEIFPDKSVPLAVEFAYAIADPGAENVMGYAFTPITEFYINFGLAGGILLPLFLCGLCLLFEVFFCGSLLLLFPLLAQLLNIQRSDFSSFLFELTLLSLSLLLVDKLVKQEFIIRRHILRDF